MQKEKLMETQGRQQMTERKKKIPDSVQLPTNTNIEEQGRE